MKRFHTASLYVSALALWSCFCLGADQVTDWGAQPGVEALTRGPIHEAFAQPLDLDGEASFVIVQRPPASIEEIPPAEKPEGDNVVWIAGYWQWDNELNDFIWVSGCWRAVPPGTAWVPGYWRETDQGYEWVAGFWKNADTRKIVYQAAPPDTLEQGPTTYAPADDRIWVSGCWIWQSSFLWQPGRYAWRPGFWLTARPDWVWVSAHYVYTPQGCVFVEGYWDYSLERRGTVFLPVHCLPEARLRVSFVFSPYLVFEVGFLTQNLFCSPGRHHYYYGDYYGERYLTQGYRPWFEPSRRGRSYEPIFAYERWRHRDDRDWAQRQRTAYEYRRDHDDARPPRTYRAMEERSRQQPGSQGRETRVARPLGEVARDPDSKVRYERTSPERRVEDLSRGRRLGDYREERSQWETPADATRRPVGNRDSKAEDRHTVTPPTQGRMEPPVRESADRTRTAPQPTERREGNRGNEDRDSHAVVPPTQNRIITPVRESPAPTRSIPQPIERTERRDDRRDSGRSTPPVVTPVPEARVTVTPPTQGNSGGERQTTRSTDQVQPRTVRVPTSPVKVERRSRSESTTPPAVPRPPKADPNPVRIEGSSTSPSDDSRGNRGSGWERRNR